MANNQAVRKILDAAKASGRTSLTAPEGKQVCDAYGIPVPKEGVATSAGDAAKLAAGMGFPVVLKIVSPEILHKTEAGGVLVGVKNADEAKKGSEVVITIVSAATMFVVSYATAPPSERSSSASPMRP